MGSSNRECAALTKCDAGQFESKKPTPSSNRECQAVTTCSVDQYESKAPTATSDRTCAALTKCATGTQYISTRATATSNRKCGSVSNCAAGSFVAAQNTATSNRICQTCETGTESQGTNAKICTDIDGCAGIICTANGDTGANCKDVPAPGVGYICEREDGTEVLDGIVTPSKDSLKPPQTNGASEPDQDQTVFGNHGARFKHGQAW